MRLRVPPAAALWLLQHLGSGYQADSLAGDLFEEYQQGRTRLWFWRQTIAALLAGRVRSLRLTVSRFVASVRLRLLKRLLAAFAATALGVGTLTWASTASKTPPATSTCACQHGSTSASGVQPPRRTLP